MSCDGEESICGRGGGPRRVAFMGRRPRVASINVSVIARGELIRRTRESPPNNNKCGGIVKVLLDGTRTHRGEPKVGPGYDGDHASGVPDTVHHPVSERSPILASHRAL